MARLLDTKVRGSYPFQYRNSAATDVRATIARERMRQGEAKSSKPTPIKAKK